MKKVLTVFLLIALVATSFDVSAQRRGSRRQSTRRSSTSRAATPNAADLKLFERAISGIATAQDSLCEKVFNSAFDKKAFTTSNVSTIRSKADAGEAWAQDIIGELYNEGMGGYSKNLPKCVEWYQKSANQNYVWGLLNLAIRYEFEEGVEEDEYKAYEYYKKAAELGNAKAMNETGDCYYYGYGVYQDYNQAVYWFKKAAEQGQAKAMYNLGYCYEHGKGIEQNQSQAIDWYTKGANKGDEDAKEALAELKGKMLVKDAYINQLEWFDNYYDCEYYFIHDISGDGVPELFVKTGECEADYELHIYTFSKGKIKKLTTTGAGHSGYKPGKNCLICGWGHMGGESYWKLYMQGGKLKSASIKKSVWNDIEDWVDEYDIDDYSAFD